MTTQRLTNLIQQHADAIDFAIARFSLPLHIAFQEVFEESASGFANVLTTHRVDGWVAFAVKSNPCRGAVRAASENGLGADVASENELRLALEEGIAPSRIICNGNAKSEAYLSQALVSRCLIALDNEDELRTLDRLASRSDAVADVLIRFRGMPLSGLTSADQTTAADWTKFGFPIDQANDIFARLQTRETVRFRGVSAHIGTQVAEPRGYECLLDHLLSLTRQARMRGLCADTLDVGGGFPVSFLPEMPWRQFQHRLLDRLRGGRGGDSVTWDDLAMGYEGQDLMADAPPWIGKAYWSSMPQAKMLSHLLLHRNAEGVTGLARWQAAGAPRLVVEPGRALWGTAGVTLAEVGGVKQVLGHHVVSLDMGINNHGTNLISPDMFPAAVWPFRSGDVPVDAFLAGRLCFSGDMISKTKVKLNRMPARGDRMVLYHTGAYAADHFASNSCGFLRPAKVLVRTDGSIECWRRTETFEEIFGRRGEDLSVPFSVASGSGVDRPTESPAST